MRAIARRPAIIVFIAFALAPLVLLGVDGPWFGGGFNPNLRPPAEFPRSLTPHTFRRASQWLNDHLGMRFPLILLDSHWRVRVWRFRFRRDVLFGHDSWLFWNDGPPAPAVRMSDVRGQLRMAPGDVARLDRQMATARDAFAACGKSALVVIAPNKQSIYPEALRDGAAYARSRLDDVLDRLAPGTRAMFVDPRAELRAAKSRRAVPVYYRTDSHWNDLGAFIAYQKIVAALAQAGAIERAELATLDDFTMHTAPFAGGDVAVRVLFLPWNFADETVELRPKKQEQSLEVRTERDRITVLNPAGKGRLTIFADSFGPPLATLLARHFREVELLSRPSWPALFDGEEIARRNADVTLIEIAERSLPELLQEPRHLERVCARR
jgi:alginate O-acetyltransferase complex protein AlgJ